MQLTCCDVNLELIDFISGVPQQHSFAVSASYDPFISAASGWVAAFGLVNADGHRLTWALLLLLLPAQL